MSQEGINSKFRNGIYNLEQKTELLDTKLTNVSSSLQSVSSSVDFLLTNNSFDSIVATGSLTFTPAAESKIIFNSLVNQGSDKAFILYKDDSSYHINGSNENSRLSIGLYNDNESTFGEGLDLQGAGSLIFNVGTWDSQLNSSIGSQNGVASGNPIKFRINNVDKAYFDSNGGITSSVGLKVGSAGIVFNDNSVLTTATMAAGVTAQQVTGAIFAFPTRAEVTGAITAVGGVNATQVSGAITGALSSYSTTSQISSSFLAITNASSSFGLNSDLTASYATKAQVTGAISNFPTRTEVTSALSSISSVSLTASNVFTNDNFFQQNFAADSIGTTGGGFSIYGLRSHNGKVGINMNGFPSTYNFEVNGTAYLGGGETSIDEAAIDLLYTDTHYKSSAIGLSVLTTTRSFDISLNQYHEISSINTNFTASFINLDKTASGLKQVINVYLLINQGATPHSMKAIQVNSSNVIIDWLNGSEPAVNANKKDLYKIKLLLNSTTNTALAYLETYG